MHHILLPVAFSERCRGAACYAAAIGCHFKAQVTVIHSLESSAIATRGFEGVALPESWYVKQRGYMQQELERFFAEELRGLDVKYVLVEGDPAHEITQYAQAESVDLIVMPTRGYGPFRRFLLGSVTAKVLHDATCPVLTGPHMEQSPQPDAIGFGCVLCAVDMGEQSAAVIDWGARFAESYGASLAIAHAVPMDELRLGGIYFDERWREDARQAARAKIMELCQGGKPDGGIHFEFGEASSTMGDVAERVGANLMVVGRSHASGFAGRLRSTGYSIVRESPCAVLSV